MTDHLVAPASNNLNVVKEDIIKASLSKLQDQEGTDFEGSTNHKCMLKRGVIKGTGWQTGPSKPSVSSAPSVNAH